MSTKSGKQTLPGRNGDEKDGTKQSSTTGGGDRLDMEAFEQAILEKIGEAKVSTPKWMKPDPWDSTKRPDDWCRFKKLFKASLFEVVDLDYLFKEGAKTPFNTAARNKWDRDCMSLYSKLLQCVKGIGQDIVL